MWFNMYVWSLCSTDRKYRCTVHQKYYGRPWTNKLVAVQDLIQFFVTEVVEMHVILFCYMIYTYNQMIYYTIYKKKSCKPLLQTCWISGKTAQALADFHIVLFRERKNWLCVWILWFWWWLCWQYYDVGQSMLKEFKINFSSDMFLYIFGSNN